MLHTVSNKRPNSMIEFIGTTVQMYKKYICLRRKKNIYIAKMKKKKEK